MALIIRRGFRAMLEAANAEIISLTAADAIALHRSAPDKHPVPLFVDLRDPREREREGAIAGAFHCPRGMLEFWIDPESPYAKPLFQEDRYFIFYCASGWRSALAAKVAQDMGLHPVAHLAGGLSAWREAGGAVVEAPMRHK
jgi:rhodanese-related sulfurtransferase